MYNNKNDYDYYYLAAMYYSVYIASYIYIYIYIYIYREREILYLAGARGPHRALGSAGHVKTWLE